MNAGKGNAHLVEAVLWEKGSGTSENLPGEVAVS